MPSAPVTDRRVPHHRVDGATDAPPLLLGPSLGTSLALWDGPAAALAATRRVVRWDLPGHGGSPADLLPETGATIADLGRLVIDLADTLRLERFAYAGVSLGGAVGLWLAVHHPERVGPLVLVCSSARFGDPAGWLDRAALVRKEGTGPLVATAADRWFTPALAAALDRAPGPARAAALDRVLVRAPGLVQNPGRDGAPGPTGTVGSAASGLVEDLRVADPAGYAACCDALADYDLRSELHRVTARTLVVGGREDRATPPAHSRELADGIAGADLTELAGAAHLAGVERPAALLAALRNHLAGSGAAAAAAGSDDHSRRAAGEAVRREVLGDAHVDRAAARATPFTAPFQDLITRYAWGEIWTRPGLDRRTRSCVTLTALVAGGHQEELAMHVRAALRNGLSADEIQEVLLQSAIYCGVPAANAAFAVADRVLRTVHEEDN